MKDIILTQATAVLTVVGLIVVTRLLAQGLGPEKFGMYALARRVLKAISPVATLAMGITLTRYVALAGKGKASLPFFLGGLIYGVVPSLAILLIGAGFSRWLSTVIFGDVKYRLVTMATLCMIAGYAFYNVQYSYYRGMARMQRANILQIALLVIAPLIIATTYAKSGNVALIIFLLGGSYCIAVVPLGWHAVRGLMSSNATRGIGSAMRKLIMYGLPRVPGSFAMSALFLTAPFLARHFGSITEAGFLVAAQSLITIAQSGIDAFALVALPKVAILFADKQGELIKKGVGDILSFVFHIGIFFTLHLALWSDQIVFLLLGPGYRGAVPVFRITAFSVMPYVLFAMLRSVIDAIEEKAINTRNLIYSLAVSTFTILLLGVFGFGVIGLAIGATIGFIVLGLSTCRYLWQRFDIKCKQFQLYWIILLNIGFIVAAWAVKLLVDRQQHGLSVVAIVSLAEIIFIGAYLFALWNLKAGWMYEIRKRLVSRS